MENIKQDKKDNNLVCATLNDIQFKRLCIIKKQKGIKISECIRRGLLKELNSIEKNL